MPLYQLHDAPPALRLPAVEVPRLTSPRFDGVHPSLRPLSLQARCTQGTSPAGSIRRSYVNVNNRGMLAYGGSNSHDSDEQVFALDFSSANWSNCPVQSSSMNSSAPMRRHDHSSCIYMGRWMVIFGGISELGDSKKLLNDVWMYDLQQHTWAKLDTTLDAEAAAAYATAAASGALDTDNNAGGGGRATRRARADRSANSASSEDGVSITAPLSRYLHSAVIICEHYMVVYGGFTHGRGGTYVLGDVIVLDLRSGVWSTIDGVVPRYSHTACVLSSNTDGNATINSSNSSISSIIHPISGRIAIVGGKNDEGVPVPDVCIVDITLPANGHKLSVSIVCAYPEASTFTLNSSITVQSQAVSGDLPTSLKSNIFAEPIGHSDLLVFARYISNSHTSSAQQQQQRNGAAAGTTRSNPFGLWRFHLPSRKWTRLDEVVSNGSTWFPDSTVWAYFTVIPSSILHQISTVRSSDPSTDSQPHFLNTSAVADSNEWSSLDSYDDLSAVFVGNADTSKLSSSHQFVNIVIIPLDQLGLWLVPDSSSTNIGLGRALLDVDSDFNNIDTDGFGDYLDSDDIDMDTSDNGNGERNDDDDDVDVDDDVDDDDDGDDDNDIDAMDDEDEQPMQDITPAHSGLHRPTSPLATPYPMPTMSDVEDDDIVPMMAVDARQLSAPPTFNDDPTIRAHLRTPTRSNSNTGSHNGPPSPKPSANAPSGTSSSLTAMDDSGVDCDVRRQHRSHNQTAPKFKLGRTKSTGTFSAASLSDYLLIPRDGAPLRAHSIILLARWPHFEDSARTGMLESTSRSMHIDARRSVVAALVCWLYTGYLWHSPQQRHQMHPSSSTIPLPVDVILDAMRLAHLYMLPGMLHSCIRLILLGVSYMDNPSEPVRPLLTPATCVSVFAAAVDVGSAQLQRHAFDMICRNYGQVVRHSLFSDGDGEDRENINSWSDRVRAAFAKMVPPSAMLLSQ
ncbi:hypothetical protein GQ42DRAFT_51246 [Ramicandelaber brevisporus]|nr:hypothetical protein GQ42DRAFT_51246 [Ramicandelaber brevisporus]